MLVEVEAIVETLRAVPPPRFQPGHVCELLAGAAARPETLRHYLHFAPGHYTRNLVYRDDLFELIALCWAPGSASPIHNHANQLCWLSIQSGALRLENFHSLDGPGPGDRVRLVSNGGIPCVSNPFDEPAVSLHVYSRPYDLCIAYDLERCVAREQRLVYHSVGGKVVKQ
jgi:cysteine dioxygenase